MKTPENWTDLPVQTRLAYKFQMERDEKKSAALTVPEVVVPRHDVQTELLPKQPREVCELLESQGREVVSRSYTTYEDGGEFKSGKRKGEKRPDRRLDMYGLITAGLPQVFAIWKGADNMWFARITYADRPTSYPRNVTELKEEIHEMDGS